MSKKIVFMPIVGLSGVGKDFFIAELLRLYPDVFHFPRSTVTRPCRGPKDNTHIFVTEQEFLEKMKVETPVSYTVYGGYQYCTFLSEFDKNKINIRAIDPIGVFATQEALSHMIDIYPILIETDEVQRFYNVFFSVKAEHSYIDAVVMSNILLETKKRLERDMDQYSIIPVHYMKKIYRIKDDTGQVHEFAKQAALYRRNND